MNKIVMKYKSTLIENKYSHDNWKEVLFYIYFYGKKYCKYWNENESWS